MSENHLENALSLQKQDIVLEQNESGTEIDDELEFGSSSYPQLIRAVADEVNLLSSTPSHCVVVSRSN